MTGDCMGDLLSPPDCAADISGFIAPFPPDGDGFPGNQFWGKKISRAILFFSKLGFELSMIPKVVIEIVIFHVQTNKNVVNFSKSQHSQCYAHIHRLDSVQFASPRGSPKMGRWNPHEIIITIIIIIIIGMIIVIIIIVKRMIIIATTTIIRIIISTTIIIIRGSAAQADTMDASQAAATISMACAGEITDCAARNLWRGTSTATNGFHESFLVDLKMGHRFSHFFSQMMINQQNLSNLGIVFSEPFFILRECRPANIRTHQLY